MARTPSRTRSLANASVGTFHGAAHIAWAAGRLPSRISRWTEPTQMPRRRAVSWTLSVASGRGPVGHSAMPSRSRTCRMLTLVQVSAPSGGQRTRFNVIAICRSGHSGASRRMTSTGLGGEGARGRSVLTRGTRPRYGVRRPSGSAARPRGPRHPDRSPLPGSGYASAVVVCAHPLLGRSRPRAGLVRDASGRRGQFAALTR